MAALNGQGVHIPFIGGIGHLTAGDALYDFPLQSDDEMAAYLGLLAVFEIFKVIPVLLGCGSWICRIVDCNAIDLLQGNGRPGIIVDGQKLYIQRRRSFPGNFLLQLSFIGWGMLLAAVMVAATFLTSLILTIFEVSSVALGGFLLSVIPILLTLPLSIFLVAYQGFTFFQYYDALQGRYHDPDQPPAAKEPPEEPKTEDYRWY